jgi:Homing endonuclease associated repeat
MASGPEAWTGDRIVAAIQAWAQRTGRPPGAEDWREATASAHPSTMRVIRVFGSWSEAIAAAGFVPRRQGSRRVGRRSHLFLPGS